MFPQVLQEKTLYAGTDIGLFHSTDGGETWQPVSDELGERSIRAFLSHPINATLYIGTLEGVFRSTDGGRNWENINTGLESVSVYVTAFALSIDDDILYAGTDGGVFRFDNDDESWRPVDNNNLDAPVTSLALHSQNGRLFAGTVDGLFVYSLSPKGQQYNWMHTGFTEAVTALAPNWQNGVLYIGARETGVFWYDIGTSIFDLFGDELPEGSNVTALALDTKKKLLYAAADRGGVFRAKLEGAWQPVNEGLPDGAVRALLLDTERGVLYAGSAEAGVFRSTNEGESWQAINEGLPDGIAVQTLAFWQAPSPRRISHHALEKLRAQHDEMLTGKRYPWRLSLSKDTGQPAFLRTWLQPDVWEELELTDDAYSPQISRLLADPYQIEAVFGVPENEKGLLDEELAMGRVIKLSAPANGDKTTLCHFTWRQIYKHYPVIGGSVRVHGVVGDERIAVTSSYFPIPANYPFTADLKPGEDPLSPRLKLDQAYEIALEAIANKLKAPASVAKQAADYQKPEQSDPAQHTFTVTRVKIRNSNYAILPFAGGYRLISRFQVQAKEQAQAPWFVDIDMKSGQVLGEPWQAVMFAPQKYYKTSAEAENSLPSGDVSDLLTDPFKTELESYINNLHNMLNSQTSSEATTVAAHALLLYKYLRETCKISEQAFSLSGQTLDIDINVSHSNTMGFIYSDPSQPKIGFWPDSQAQGISVEDESNDPKLIYRPAGDPEVVMHEFTHGFLWLLNPDPWDKQAMLKVNPFGRALHEGYAMYLSRSLAAQAAGEALANRWARAAYRPKKKNSGDSNWEDRWELGLNKSNPQPGADYLLVPNTYPTGSYSTVGSAGYLAYDVGMVWARSLWDLRTLLGAELTDWLVMQGYFYLHGHIANFELAVEGMLDADLKLNDMMAARINLVNGSQPVWAKRGVTAGQGIHNFAQADDGTLIAASDLGVLKFDGAQWQLEHQLNNGRVLTGVVAVAADGAALYAAAQLPPNESAGENTQWNPGIFHKNVSDSVWEALGDWPETATPLNLLKVKGLNIVVVGSSYGVYYRENNQPWQLIEEKQGPPLDDNNRFRAVDITAISIAGAAILQACTPTGLRQTITNNLHHDWSLPGGVIFNGHPARPTTVVRGKHGTYVGTNVRTQGDNQWKLWKLGFALATTAAYTETGAILASAANHSNANPKLYIATNEKICVLNERATVPPDLELDEELPLPANGAVVISLFVAQDNTLLAGTLAHGIWRYNNNMWEKEPTPVPHIPANILLRPKEKALFSFTQSVDTSSFNVNISNAISNNIKLLIIAQPGFPIKPVSKNNGNAYTLSSGPVMLALVNNSAGSAFNLTISLSDNAIDIT